MSTGRVALTRTPSKNCSEFEQANNGTKRRSWILWIVLSRSRKGYSEVVWRQTTDDFIAALENAFGHVGGVPKQLVIEILLLHVRRASRTSSIGKNCLFALGTSRIPGL